MKNLIIASTSTVHGSGFLEYLLPELRIFFNEIQELIFVPYARPGGISHEQYTEKVRQVFSGLNIKVKGLHEFEDTTKAIQQAEGIFVGGGNTFVLVDQLYKNNLISEIYDRVNNGIPYLGTSAGSNICGLTISTTNDMPIVYPPSFKTLSFVPFNINPHYLDPDPTSKHMGETRETRIQEFHKFNTQPVVGLREGSFLKVNGDQVILKGDLTARVFKHSQSPYEVLPETDLSDLN